MRWILVALGIALVLIYIATTLTGPPAPTATSVPPALPSTVTTTQSTSLTQTTETTRTTTSVQTTTAQTTQTSQQPPLSTTPPASLPKRGPLLHVSIHAPAQINATELPLNVTYTVVIMNKGDETGVVYINGEEIRVDPASTMRINGTITARHAGNYAIEVVTPNGTETRVVKVLYYAPRLVAEPEEIEVGQLPATVTLNITVRNMGNYTGEIDGVKIEPGGFAVIKKTLNVTAAGRYVVRIGRLEAPIRVIYRYAQLQVEVQEREYEAVLHEEITITLLIKNIGNKTAQAEIAGRNITIEPGQTKTVGYRVKAEKAGTYQIEVKDGRAIYRQDVMIKIIAVSVDFLVEKPQSDNVGPGKTATFKLGKGQVDIVWRPAVYTNATRRTVTLEVDGRYVQVKPRDYVELDSRSETAQVPGEAVLKVTINGTIYEARIRLEIKPPTITVRDIFRIEVRDNRQAQGIKLICLRPIQYSFRIDINWVEIQVNFNDKITFSGVVSLGGDAKGDVNFVGEAAGVRGWAQFSNIYIPVVGRSISVKVNFTTDPLAVEKVEIPGAPPDVQCNFPTELLPKYFKKPLGSYQLDEYAALLVNLLAKTESDKTDPYASIQYDGEKITLSDRRGNVLTLRTGEGVIEISGALSAKIYADYYLS